MKSILTRVEEEDADWPRLFAQLCEDLEIPVRTRKALRNMIGYTEREWFIGVVYRINNNSEQQRKALRNSTPEWWAGTLTYQRQRRTVRQAVQEVSG